MQSAWIDRRFRSTSPSYCTVGARLLTNAQVPSILRNCATVRNRSPQCVRMRRIKLQRQAPWWTGEKPIRLGDVAKHVPRRPNGRRMSIQSIFRWTTAGVAGVRLRRFRAPGCWATTVEEVHRFLAAVTEAEGGDVG